VKNVKAIEGVSIEHQERRTRQLINKFRDTRDVAPLSKLSYDESYIISKYYLIHELVKIGRPVVPQILEMVNDKNPLVRELAIKTLGEIEDPTVTPVIVVALRDEKRRVRNVALAALKKLTRLSFGSYARHNQSHENQKQVINKWLNWWGENSESFMVDARDKASMAEVQTAG
jgi:hypothetical protein